MHVAVGGRNYSVVESKLTGIVYNPNKTCLAYVYVWFTLSDSPNWTVT